jgi:hypothetical protein
LADVFINPLSANYQHVVTSQVETAVASIVACFRFIRLAVASRRVRLIYDDSIETRSLMANSNGIIAEIGALPNKDLRTEWYLYTKNHAMRAKSDLTAVVVSGGREAMHGTIREELTAEGARWLSFGGTALNERHDLSVAKEDGSSQTEVANAFDLETFARWWPKYEANPKHRKEGYVREGGERVSPMPLDDHTAQQVLMMSVSDGGDRFGFYRGQYYRFCRTHIDQEVFHGFSVAREDIPVAIFVEIEN